MKCFLSTICDSSTYARSKMKADDKIHYFGAPKGEELLQKWRNAIASSGCNISKPLKKRDVLCHRHFTNDDIIWTFPEVAMPDGKIFFLKRDRPILKKDVVPSIFIENETVKIEQDDKYYWLNVPMRKEPAQDPGLELSDISDTDF